MQDRCCQSVELQAPGAQRWCHGHWAHCTLVAQWRRHGKLQAAASTGVENPVERPDRQSIAQSLCRRPRFEASAYPALTLGQGFMHLGLQSAPKLPTSQALKVSRISSVSWRVVFYSNTYLTPLHSRPSALPARSSCRLFLLHCHFVTGNHFCCLAKKVQQRGTSRCRLVTVCALHVYVLAPFCILPAAVLAFHLCSTNTATSKRLETLIDFGGPAMSL